MSKSTAKFIVDNKTRQAVVSLNLYNLTAFNWSFNKYSLLTTKKTLSQHSMTTTEITKSTLSVSPLIGLTHITHKTRRYRLRQQ